MMRWVQTTPPTPGYWLLRGDLKLPFIHWTAKAAKPCMPIMGQKCHCPLAAGSLNGNGTSFSLSESTSTLESRI